jgi:hypothetical protein
MRIHRIIWAAGATLALTACVLDEGGSTAPAVDASTDTGTITTDAGTDAVTGACQANVDCGKSQFCAKPTGQCGGGGECKPIPATCPATPPPAGGVCGCDAKGYSDACAAAASGVSVDHTGACAGKACNPMSMAPGALCPGGQYCATPEGQCAAMGVCKDKPLACDTNLAQVCGCDGTTYSNGCFAAGASTGVAKQGACLTYFTTCGGPVCPVGEWKPTDGVPLCTTQSAGGTCTTEGEKCDGKAGCGVFLVCAKADPKLQGCPISRARFKTAIEYVPDAEAQALATELLQMRLATYRYKAAGDGAPRHLGFLIDEQRTGSPLVDAERDMVDLYGYLSMSVATLQVQQRRIEALEREVQALERLAARPGR